MLGAVAAKQLERRTSTEAVLLAVAQQLPSQQQLRQATGERDEKLKQSARQPPLSLLQPPESLPNRCSFRYFLERKP